MSGAGKVNDGQAAVGQVSDGQVNAGQTQGVAARVWRKDGSLWRLADAAVCDRLGWLHAAQCMQSQADEMCAWARRIAQSGRYKRVIVLGMGGASQAAAVVASLFPAAAGYLRLQVIDTTHPETIADFAAQNLRECLFVVASKSGDTLETIALYHFFRAQLHTQGLAPGEIALHFAFITDADSALHRLAKSHNCAHIFLNPADIGGRFSALSYFGMLPAALVGAPVAEILHHAQLFCATTQVDGDAYNPALALGNFIGRFAAAGRDKMILHLPSELQAFGRWIEQLIAESTGKHGVGVLPVIVAAADGVIASDDLMIVRLTIGDGDRDLSKAQAENSPPQWKLHLNQPTEIGAEFFRWQFATVIAAVHLRVNPFDQPDVAASKANTLAFLHRRESLPPPTQHGFYDLHYSTADSPAASSADSCTVTVTDLITEFRRHLKPGDYLGVLAYLPEDARTLSLLHALCAAVTAGHSVVATIGFGPRYLHSTGQLHKGGPPNGRFIQLVDRRDDRASGHTAKLASEHAADLAVPQCDYTFAQLCQAQADGDFAALAVRTMVLRVLLKADRLRALAAFIGDIKAITQP